MSQSFNVQTAFGTLLHVRPDGLVVHCPPGQFGLLPVIAEIADITDNVWRLRSEENDALTIEGADHAHGVVLPMIAVEDPSGLRLGLPSGGKEIVAASFDGQQPGAVFAGRPGSVFRRHPYTTPATVPPPLDLSRAADMLGAADPATIPFAAAQLQAMPFAEMREAWQSVTDAAFHDELFPIVQHRTRAELGSFGGYTRDLLQADIDKHGWSIGTRTYGRPLVIEAGRGMLSIGRFCAMADPTIVLANHRVRAASTYPFMDLWAEWPGSRLGLTDHIARDVVVGNDVWIGVGAVILPGAVVGDGALVGAGAVVRGDVPPYGICLGNPGEVQRYRFPPGIIERLLAIRWWDWPDAVVSRYIPLLIGSDIADFLTAAELEFGPAHAGESLAGGVSD